MIRVALLMVPIILIGCDRKAEVRQVTKPLESKPDSVGFPLQDPPKQSDPATLETISKIVAAHTNNQPAILTKLTGVTLIREGQFTIKDTPISGVGVKQTWYGVWPGKGRSVWNGMAPYPLTFRVLDDKAFKDAPATASLPPLAEKNYQDVIRDNAATWLQLLIPMTEPGAIVAPGPDFQSSLQSLKGIRVWRPGMPQAIVSYDPKTMLIGRISYDGRDNAMPVHIEQAFFDFKPMSGFQIAQRIYVRQNGREFMEFTKVEFEIAKNHPATLFTEP